MRRSRLTGYHESPGFLPGMTHGLPLYDGAVGVPCRERGAPGTVVSYVGGDGQIWRTFVCCGPDAPAPYRYSETVEQVRGHRSLRISEHLPDGRIRTYTRQYPSDLVDEVGLDAVWESTRYEYAAAIRGEQQ